MTMIAQQLQRAHLLRQSGQTLQAELIYLEVLTAWPENTDVLSQLAELAMVRGDAARAIGFLETAVGHEPGNCPCVLNLAVAYLAANEVARARERLESTLKSAPSFFVGWLLLGQVLEEQGQSASALRAYFEAVTRARAEGRWMDEQSTPPGLLSVVLHAIEKLRSGRRELLEASYGDIRAMHGSSALMRVDRALSGYLRDWDATPVDERQRPKFFFFPDVPNTPYHDPFLQPWARQLQAAYPLIRADAIRVLEEDRHLPNFIPDGARVEDFVSGEGPAPSWEAFFFYRHGERYDANHRRCPQTSAVLESIELCQIAEQAPEILFSVLKPGSHINAHHGVTNVRLVMHLPLVVPRDCALNLVDRGEHHWQEGQLVMFDDTFLHEAWNRSDQTRIILLMDCWNPHLTGVEKRAVKHLIETITALHACDRQAAVIPAAG